MPKVLGFPELRGKRVRVFEVGPRDGLQNEPRALTTAQKLRFIQGVIDAGARDIEVGAFVRPDRVPQMADTDRIYRAIHAGRIHTRGARLWALVPNRRGWERAQAAGVRHVAVFTAATESFAKRNIGMSIRESLQEYRAIFREAKEAGVQVRGYVSTAFGCPFEGPVRPAQALRVVMALAEMGAHQVSVGDTIGVATPDQVDPIVEPLLRDLDVDRIAMHYHDTRGTALANALRSLQLGVRTLDASAGGLGGCPFAPSATGNLATEDLLYMLNGIKMKTGLDLDRYARLSLSLSRKLRRPLSSRYLSAVQASYAKS